MLTYIVIAVALLLVVSLAFSDKLPFLRHSNATSAALREVPAASPTSNSRHWMRWGLPVIAAIIAVGLYAAFSNRSSEATLPKVSMPQAALPNVTAATQQSNAGGDLKVAVKHLASKLEQNPRNGEGWALLAHTYVELHQYPEAEAAFMKADALLPPNAKMLADWADAHVVVHDRKWDEQGRNLVKRALAADPKHLKSLALAGSEAFERADYQQAIAYWTQLQAAAPANSMYAKLAEANIQEANAKLALAQPAKNN